MNGSINTLFLDAGGVLVFPNWQRVSDALAAHVVRIEPDVLATAEPYAKRRLDAGEIIAGSTDRQRSFPYFNLVLEEAKVPQSPGTDAALADLHAYHAAHNLWEIVPGDVPPALARLRALGLRLVVISNANGRLHTCFDRVGLTGYLDAVFDSHDEGVEKPNPRLFQIAFERTGTSPDTTMHVGDLYHVDIVGARNASIRPVLLDPLGLYADADCPRVTTLDALADRVETGWWS